MDAIMDLVIVTLLALIGLAILMWSGSLTPSAKEDDQTPKY